MSQKIAFCSGCDSNYFHLLIEWIASLRTFPEGQNADICILDSGMTEDELDILRPLVTKIFAPDWPCKIPSYKIRGREYLKSCVCRPFLPEYFPGYDVYFWMDADTWIQNWEAVELFLKGANRKKMTVTGQVDRAYPRHTRIKWLYRMPFKLRGFYFSNAKKAFSFKKAKELFPYHVLLAGAFALHKEAIHWKRWQELVTELLQSKKGKVFTAEQLTLGVMVYLEKYPVEILPGWCHWLCDFAPHWDKKNNKFVEPYLPHKELGILHISGHDDMRHDKSITMPFKVLDHEDETVDKTLRFCLPE